MTNLPPDAGSDAGSNTGSDNDIDTGPRYDHERAVIHDLLRAATSDIRDILEHCLEGRTLGWEQGVRLASTTGPDLDALCAAADFLRRQQAGDVVTYVVNRNINFTNVCIKSCQFCAFSRDLGVEQGYLLSPEEVVRRALEAQELGATEVCLQAGLAPSTDGHLYIDLCRAIKAAAPALHIHGFSPEEVKYGALRARMPVRDYLQALRDAGLGSMPGTSAEILDDDVRARISPGRITTAQWIEVITTAHALGLPTTATMMFGHVETATHCMRHMDLLRSIQNDTGGFTEFVPLSFVHTQAPMFLTGRMPGVRPGATQDEVVRIHAIARLMLGPTFRNIQISWVKEGMPMAQRLLACGANDLGGTLINESISTAAGAPHGQRQTPSALQAAIRAAGRIPAERDTRYRVLRRFDGSRDSTADAGAHDASPLAPLDVVQDSEARFGSYEALTRDPRFRHQWQKPRKAEA